jgi:hypothetical protein
LNVSDGVAGIVRACSNDPHVGTFHRVAIRIDDLAKNVCTGGSGILNLALRGYGRAARHPEGCRCHHRGEYRRAPYSERRFARSHGDPPWHRSAKMELHGPAYRARVPTAKNMSKRAKASRPGLRVR